MKKALFASAAVFTLATASTAIAITQEEEVQSTSNEEIPTSNELKNELHSLKEETNAYLAVTNEQLNAYEQALDIAWKESFKTDLRLTAKHITFSNRLALHEEKLLHSSRTTDSLNISAQQLNLLTSSAITAYEIDQFLSGTAMSGLGSAFVNAEIKTGVNALFLTSLAIHESAWGKSRIAQNKNNLFGYGAYDRSPYESAVHFSTKQEGIIFVANKLKENYLLPSGRYHKGTSLSGVNVRYSSDQKWGNKIATTMSQLEVSAIQNQDTSYEVTK